MPKRQCDDRCREDGRDRVVEDHEPNAPLAIEQGAGDRAQGKPRKDREEHGQARQAG